MSALSRPKSNSRAARRQVRGATRKKLRQHRSRRSSKSTARATETATVLGVNIMLIGGCLYTLASMLPQQLTQQAKLREIKGEVHRTAEHVNHLRQTHSRSLIPEESQRISEEQGHLIKNNKRNLVWLKSTKTKKQP